MLLGAALGPGPRVGPWLAVVAARLTGLRPATVAYAWAAGAVVVLGPPLLAGAVLALGITAPLPIG